MFGIGRVTHVVLVAITVIGGGLMVTSVVVRVVVMMTVSLTVGRMYWVQNALALYWYSERERMTASVMHALARVAMIASRTNEAGKCILRRKFEERCELPGAWHRHDNKEKG